MLVNKIKKEKAIKLRKQGHTYSEILKEINVAKSTLSEWFRDVGLSIPEQQKLTEKKLAAARRGGASKKLQRINKVREIHEKALLDINSLSKRELWLIGIVLYWAEGTKEKEYRPGSGIQFGNSDPRMIKVFLRWLTDSVGVKKNDVLFDIYIHENSKNNLEKVRNFWSKTTGFSLVNFDKVYFKKNKIKTNRKNIETLYFGLLRVKVKSSSGLVRQISGWTEAIVKSI